LTDHLGSLKWISLADFLAGQVSEQYKHFGSGNFDSSVVALGGVSGFKTFLKL